jgi:hypothetical protein
MLQRAPAREHDGAMNQTDQEHAAAASVEMPSAAEIYELIAQAAYYRAEKRGFTPGLEADDWLQAETEVMERLRARHTAGGA